MMAKQRVKVKRLGVLSVGFFFAVLMALYALIIGIVVFAVGDVGQGSGVLVTAGGGAVEAIVGIVVSVIVFAIGGFIGGAIAAFIYNLVFAATGGIEVDLEMLD